MTVSTQCLGTMMFGEWGRTDEAECRRILDVALDGGVNFVDTADVYASGESETILGHILKGRRDDVVLATKFSQPMGEDPNQRGNSRRWIMRAAEESLRRLQTDWIDLYQVHRPDPGCDIDQTLGALTDLVQAGKVRAIGTTTFPAEYLVSAQWVAEKRGRERFVTEQPPYSIFARAVEASVLPACRDLGLGVIVWSPLNGGWLTGKYRRGQEVPADSRAARHPGHFDYEHRSGNASLTWWRRWRESPARPGSRSPSWPSHSCSNTPRSRRRSSGRAPPGSSPASCRPATSFWTPTCSTRSTPWSSRDSTCILPTPAGFRRRCGLTGAGAPARPAPEPA
jgi:aryl-alcohol dehydrogenase-like predicted oxidoreductase